MRRLLSQSILVALLLGACKVITDSELAEWEDHTPDQDADTDADADTDTDTDTDADTDTDTDTDASPSCEITAPNNGAEFTRDDTVTFEGGCTDPEDGDLTGGDLAWSSDLDGTFGTGSPLSTDALSQGNHVIQLEGTDSAGKTGIDEIQVRIRPN